MFIAYNVNKSIERREKLMAQGTDKEPLKHVVARVPRDVHKALIVYTKIHDTNIQAVMIDLLEQYLRERGALPGQTPQSERLAQSA
jgi:predicted transglutaminase-like cysteine proteinase